MAAAAIVRAYGGFVVFSSANFIFLFLPVALLIILGARRWAFRWTFLGAILAVSLAFYYWSAGMRTLILVGIIVVNYLGALALERWRGRAMIAGLILINLAVLFWFKYADFVAANLDDLLGTDLGELTARITLPAGISFFVFQAISYLMDVRRGDIGAERSLARYGAYQSFFPHLIAGPIVRFRDVIGDFIQPRLSVDNFAAGVTRFSHGLFKKIVIADNVAPVADAVFALPPGEMDFASSWVGAIAFALQIYFDFSGYSDMAIGMAMMVGIRFTENFTRPYASRSITEFWRRWHITLSSWFRDYLYIPLGGNRGGSLATYRNLLIVFIATGLWHGAAWTFLLWGIFHGLFLMLERMLCKAPLEVLRAPWLRYCYCLPVVLFGWVLFRADTLGGALAHWREMVLPFQPMSFAALSERAALTPYSLGALLVGGLVLVLPGRLSFGQALMDARGGGARPTVNFAYTTAALGICGVLMLAGKYSPFLYFRF